MREILARIPAEADPRVCLHQVPRKLLGHHVLHQPFQPPPEVVLKADVILKHHNPGQAPDNHLWDP